MMLRARAPVLLVAHLFLVAACAPDPLDEESLVLRAIDHAALGFTQQSIRQPSAHAADTVEIWAAPEAAAAYQALVPGNAASAFPTDAMIVKRHYVDDAPDGLTVMAKVAGFNSAGGDWWWARIDNDGIASPSGAVGFCLDCHSDTTRSDFVFGVDAENRP